MNKNSNIEHDVSFYFCIHNVILIFYDASKQLRWRCLLFSRNYIYRSIQCFYKIFSLFYLLLLDRLIYLQSYKWIYGLLDFYIRSLDLLIFGFFQLKVLPFFHKYIYIPISDVPLEFFLKNLLLILNSRISSQGRMVESDYGVYCP